MQTLPLPHKAQFVEENGNHYVFVFEALYPGYGTTIGNSLRRVLLSSVPGAAVTAFKIKGIDHEFSSVPNVREDVIEIMLSLKQLRLKVYSEEPVVLFLKKKGEGVVTAGDIEENDQVEVINKDLHIATLDNKSADFEMEIVVGQGRGYVPVEQREGERSEIGLIQIDAVYSPVKSVSYDVENVRVGQMTNYDKLTLTIDTDGSVTGKEVLDVASRILLDHFTILLEGVTPPVLTDGIEEEKSLGESESDQTDSQSSVLIEDLNLSSRSLNALKKNGIKTADDLKKYTRDELVKLEGLGEKSINEIVGIISTLE